MVQITVDLSGAMQKLSAQNQQRGQHAMANQMLADMNNYVPALNHDLRNSATIDTDGKAINWNMPYAGPQFYGFINGSRIYNYTTPGTSRRWDLRAMKHMNDWTKAYAKGADL